MAEIIKKKLVRSKIRISNNRGITRIPVMVFFGFLVIFLQPHGTQYKLNPQHCQSFKLVGIQYSCWVTILIFIACETLFIPVKNQR